VAGVTAVTAVTVIAVSADGALWARATGQEAASGLAGLPKEGGPGH
jgi:hypothetical protein